MNLCGAGEAAGEPKTAGSEGAEVALVTGTAGEFEDDGLSALGDLLVLVFVSGVGDKIDLRSILILIL